MTAASLGSRHRCARLESVILTPALPPPKLAAQQPPVVPKPVATSLCGYQASCCYHKGAAYSGTTAGQEASQRAEVARVTAKEAATSEDAVMAVVANETPRNPQRKCTERKKDLKIKVNFLLKKFNIYILYLFGT
jgi:hypothetical protein